MNRALPKVEGKVSPVRAVALGATLPRTLRGGEPAIALQSIGDFQVRNEAAAKQFEEMYATSADPRLQATGRETFEAVAMLQAIQRQPYTPANGADYPRGRFGDSLQQIAQLIKSDVGMEMAFADIGGWDHHVNEVGQRASEGQLAVIVAGIRPGAERILAGHGRPDEDVAVVTMSEFGRTAHENGNRGTDHGHANCMFAMGGGGEGRQGIRQVAGPGNGAALRRARPGAHHRFPRRARRTGGEAHGQRQSERRISGLFPEIPGPGLGITL